MHCLILALALELQIILRKAYGLALVLRHHPESLSSAEASRSHENQQLNSPIWMFLQLGFGLELTRPEQL